MTLTDAIALSGVVVTVIAVIVAVAEIRAQGRQLGKQLCLQSFVEYTKRYQELLTQIPGELLARNDLSAEELRERQELLPLLRAYFDLCFEEYYLHSHGFIDEALWKVWLGGMEFAFRRPIVQHGWRQIQESIEYPGDFKKFVDSAVVG